MLLSPLQAYYMKYLRETGAEMDIDQFAEIFGARAAASRLWPAGRSLDDLQTILSDRQAPYYEHEVMATKTFRDGACSPDAH